MKSIIKERIDDSIRIKQDILDNTHILESIKALTDETIKALKNSHKLIICGNGGSASDALHFAGEIVGRYQQNRNPWPAIVLNSDVTAMTAISNDYGYEEVFSRQAKAYCRPGDIFIGISTSGNSENVYRAARVSKEKGAITAALLGCDGGKIAPIVDYPVIVPCDVTARVQECHILIIHIICELVENALCKENN